MKKTYTLIISFFLISGTIFSQITVPDFTLTDIDGNSYNLYQELAEGKTVVLDFFALQCGTCQTGIAYVENVWQTFGSNGDDLWVWAIESSGGTNLDIQDFVQVNGGSFPGFSITENDTLYSFFNITYTPQYFVICPNGQIKSCAVDQVGNYVEACIGLSIAPGQQESN
ncbi:MAG: TlpA disulfide reductase family protein, partial [Bacteroidota bacterium]|nr:TlpA disulfide reductase family protein [Bacteroidota bacterium]